MNTVPGTKIKVIASNCPGKGPHAGSVGYIVKTYHSTFPPGTLARHMKGYGVTNSTNLASIYSRAIDVVFTRFGRNGKSRISRKSIRCVLPELPEKITEKWAKMFLKSVVTFGIGKYGQVIPSNRINVIIPILEEPVSIKDMSFEELLAKTYSMLIYAIRHPAISLSSNNGPNNNSGFHLGPPKSKKYVNRTAFGNLGDKDRAVIRNKHIWAVVKEMATKPKVYTDGHRKVMREEVIEPAYKALQLLLAHTLYHDINRIGSNRPVVRYTIIDMMLTSPSIINVVLPNIAQSPYHNFKRLIQSFHQIVELNEILGSLSTDK